MTAQRDPCISVNISNQQTPQVPAKKVLLVGKMESTGTATSKQLTENVTLQNVGSLFGEFSLIADAFREFKAINPFSIVDVFPVLATGGVDSTATVLLTGTAASAGTIDISVIKKKSGVAQDNKGNAHISVLVESGDTAEVISTKIDSALTAALENSDPFTYTINVETLVTPANREEKKEKKEPKIKSIAPRAVGDVTITFTSKIQSGVSDTFLLDITGVDTIGGLTLDVSYWNGGSATYDLTLAELEAEAEALKYALVAWVSNDIDTNILVAFLENRRNIACNEDLTAEGYFTYISNFVDIKNKRADGNISDLVRMIVDKEENNDGTLPSNVNPSWGTPSHIITTQVVASLALREVEGASISDIMTSTKEVAKTGSILTLALPYSQTILNNIPYRSERNLTGYSRGFSKVETDELQSLGITYLQCKPAIQRVTLGVVGVTSFPTSNRLAKDITLEFLHASRINVILNEWATQTGYTNGELPSGNDGFENKTSLRALLATYLTKTSKQEGLLEPSEASLKFSLDSLVIGDIDPTTRTVTVTLSLVLPLTLQAVTANLNFLVEIPS